MKALSSTTEILSENVFTPSCTDPCPTPLCDINNQIFEANFDAFSSSASSFQGGGGNSTSNPITSTAPGLDRLLLVVEANVKEIDRLKTHL